MADVSNLEITQLSELSIPILLYVEGETDERLLRGWSTPLGMQEILNQVCFRVMRGGSKDKMKADSDSHFKGGQQVIPSAKRLILLDYDDETTFHPEQDNPVLYEWQRKNIENYLLVSDAWTRAALKKIGIGNDDIFSSPIRKIIEDFFAGENLTLPPGQSWRTVKANIFQVVDGKRLLFENSDSLFQRLKSHQLEIQSTSVMELTREIVAASMISDEIHEDVHAFFGKLNKLLK